MSKCCIVNAAQNSWYPRGQVRLIHSLLDNGYTGDILAYTDVEIEKLECIKKYDVCINSVHDRNFPYTIKAAAIKEALDLNKYEIIIWLDCSIRAIRNIDTFIEMVETEGYYFWKSGYTIGQTSSDSDLEWAEWSRAYADTKIECASSIFAFKPNTEQGRIFSDLFIDAAENGVCNTSRNHANQSSSPQFLFARQDQTAASIAFHKAGYAHMYDPGIDCHGRRFSSDQDNVFSSYEVINEKNNNSVYFLLKGM